jgi:hypothetical protein
MLSSVNGRNWPVVNARASDNLTVASHASDRSTEQKALRVSTGIRVVDVVLDTRLNHVVVRQEAIVCLEVC